MSSSVSALSESLKGLTLESKIPQSAAEEFASKYLDEFETAEQAQWLTLATRLPDNLTQLNDALRSKVYILGTTFVTPADVAVFTNAYELIKSWKEEDCAKYRHIVRWFDLIQHSGAVAVPESDIIKFNLDLPVERELKAKPEKKGGKEEKKEGKKDKKESKKDKKTEGAAAGAGEAVTGEKKEKKEKKKKEKKEKPKQEKAPEELPNPSMIDLRVGFIQKAIKHPDADTLYVSTIEMGDADGPRTVCSGLAKVFPLEYMQEKTIVTVANLKPVKMRGILSCAMVLCASNEDGKIEFVQPPAGSKPGDKLFFEGYDGEPLPQLNPKKKIWEAVQPNFSTTESLEVVYIEPGTGEVKKLVNKDGEVCKVESLVKASVR